MGVSAASSDDLWQAIAKVAGVSQAIAVGTSEPAVREFALSELVRRNLPACRLWQSVNGKWVDAGEPIWNVEHDRSAPTID
jgi:hypothetical protein